MPWSMKDAPAHTKKADTPAKKKQFAKVANKVLKQSGDEGKALRIAKSAVKKHPAKAAKAKAAAPKRPRPTMLASASFK